MLLMHMDRQKQLLPINQDLFTARNEKSGEINMIIKYFISFDSKTLSIENFQTISYCSFR